MLLLLKRVNQVFYYIVSTVNQVFHNIYGHSVCLCVQECYKEGNVVKLMDVPTPPEPVSARKTLFEAGEAWNQNAARAVSSKVDMVIIYTLLYIFCSSVEHK